MWDSDLFVMRTETSAEISIGPDINAPVRVELASGKEEEAAMEEGV